MIRRLLSRLIHEDQGQDLTEYTLLIAMVSLVAFSLFAGTGTTAAGVWNGAGDTLASAGSTAAGTAVASGGSPIKTHIDHDRN
jgi:Flp pilus assembly pilin Flp